jgi:hypothetical protein
MSIKRQIRNKYQNFKFSIQTISLPAWLTSPAVRIGLFAVIFIFGGAYIFNISGSAMSGYQIKVLNDKTESLQAEVQKLEVQIADNSSINSIATRVAKLNMVESVGVAKQLALKNNEVAKK